MTQDKNDISSYLQILNTLKDKIKTAQLKAALSVNSQLIILYWEIGQIILTQQKEQGWGAKVIQTLAKDLQNTFPNIKGLSERNLKYMRKFAETYTDIQFVQQLAAQIPWWHNVIILEKVSIEEERKWYINQTINNNWSRNVLSIQIESKLYKRQALTINKSNNFSNTMPKLESDLALQIIKDPYNFDFLYFTEKAKEKDIEDGLIENISKFLLELGKGFAFIGKQYPLQIGDQDYYLDLLFYNVKMHCYVVMEIKIGEFKPEYAGKMNFYLSAVDSLLKTEKDNSSIGIILCKTKNKITAEYALKDISKPMGISEYILSRAVSKELKASLPTIDEIEKELINDNKLLSGSVADDSDLSSDNASEFAFDFDEKLADDEFFVYSDGAVSGNPGVGGIACVIFDKDGVEIAARNENIGIATNNIAEYKAILLALKTLQDIKAENKRINFFADSELMVKQIKGEYKIVNTELQKLCMEFLGTIRKFRGYSITHIPREKNKVADNLAVLAKSNKIINRRIK